jgi:hypothetical protein
MLASKTLLEIIFKKNIEYTIYYFFITLKWKVWWKDLVSKYNIYFIIFDSRKKNLGMVFRNFWIKIYSFVNSQPPRRVFNFLLAKNSRIFPQKKEKI